jgi:hypothetical protein
MENAMETVENVIKVIAPILAVFSLVLVPALVCNITKLEMPEQVEPISLSINKIPAGIALLITLGILLVFWGIVVCCLDPLR